MKNLRECHALVTGGATGIGLAVARRLLESGVKVTIASRNLERLQEAVKKVSGLSYVSMDVTELVSVEAAVNSIEHIDILVNNAGAAFAAPFHETSLEDWTKMLAVNLTGTFLCTQAVLAGMRKNGQGRIITIASTAGLKGYAYTAAYSAAKHGVVGMTRALALELASTDITVNCVCPGFTDTDMVAKALTNIAAKTGLSKDEALQQLLKHNPQGRLIDPEEVAASVVWLCEDNSRSINGQTITIAGGEAM